MDFWKNKIVWVTGASSGIGEALAVSIAEKGARLILSARNTQKLEAVKAHLNDPENHLVLPLDMHGHSRFPDHYTKVIDKFGKVDVLINNAGVSQRALGVETADAVEDDLFAINFFGPIRLAKTVLPDMLQRQTGSIVNISSVSGKFGFPLRTSYAASKHALHGYFDSLRFEVEKQGINILMVCPGRVKTNISFHARTSDGSVHAEMDPGQESGLGTEYCARQIMQAIEGGKNEIYIGKESALVYLKRWWPAAFRFVVRRVKAK